MSRLKASLSAKKKVRESGPFSQSVMSGRLSGPKPSALKLFKIGNSRLAPSTHKLLHLDVASLPSNRRIPIEEYPKLAEATQYSRSVDATPSFAPRLLETLFRLPAWYRSKLEILRWSCCFLIFLQRYHKTLSDFPRQ